MGKGRILRILDNAQYHLTREESFGADARDPIPSTSQGRSIRYAILILEACGTLVQLT